MNKRMNKLPTVINYLNKQMINEQINELTNSLINK